jgi:H+-transporting ATPase
MFLIISVLFFNFYPVTPLMVVLLVILNDIPIMLHFFRQRAGAEEPGALGHETCIGDRFPAGSYRRLIFAVAVLVYPRLFKTAGTNCPKHIFLKLLVAGHMTIFLTRNMGWLWNRPFPNLFYRVGGYPVVGNIVRLGPDTGDQLEIYFSSLGLRPGLVTYSQCH